MPPKKTKKTKRCGGSDNIKYIIEKVDIDSDGIVDGVLIKRYRIDNQNNKHYIDQKFVPNDKIQAELFEYTQHHPDIQPQEFNQNPRSNGGIKIADERTVQRFEDGGQFPITQRVIMQDDTSLAQYFKQGVGVGAGFAVVDVVSGFFTGE